MGMKFDFSKLAVWGEKLGFRNARPPLEGLYIYVLLFFMGALVADFATTFVRTSMLPMGGITNVKPLAGRSPVKKPQISVFSGIKDKNIFNADHFIPESLGEQQKGGEFEDQSTPTLSSLPLELVGTIIHARHELSVATIQIRGKDIHAVMEEEELDGMAKIYEITRHKVVFRNLSTRKLEYIEIKEENTLQIGLVKSGSSVQMDQPEKTNFKFRREEINTYLDDLPRVLQDAKAVPYVVPGSGGEIGGFKMVAIKPGSIYEKLGLKTGDILKGVNGEMVDSPQKAMELYQALKNSSDIQLDITRNGQSSTLNYTLE